MKYHGWFVLLFAGCTGAADIRGQNAEGTEKSPAKEYSAFANDNAPLLLSSVPLDGGVLASGSLPIYLSFSEALAIDSVNEVSLLLTRNGEPVAATFNVSQSIVTVSGSFRAGPHVLTITQEVRDESGTPLAQLYTLGFTVVGAPPFVVAALPANQSVQYTRTPVIVLELSEPVSATLDDITLTGASGPVDGSLTGVGSLLYFKPNVPLLPGSYELKADTDVRDVDGETLAAAYVAQFSVDGTPPATPVLTLTPAFGSITLDWSPVSDVDLQRYVLVRRSDRSPVFVGDGEQIYAGLADQYVDTSARSAPHYFYAVFAVDTADNASAPGLAEADAVFAIRLNVTSPASMEAMPSLVCEIFSASEREFIVPLFRLTQAVAPADAVNHVFEQIVPGGTSYQAFCFRDSGDGSPQHASLNHIQEAERVSPLLQVTSLCADASCSLAVNVNRAFFQSFDHPAAEPRVARQPHTRHDPYADQEDCGGYTLHFAQRTNASFLDPNIHDCSVIVGKPIASAPTYTLRDDGQCDLERYGEFTNGSSSHDKRSGDGVYSFGLRNPTSADAGEWVYRTSCVENGAVLIARHPRVIDEIIDLPAPLFAGPFAPSGFMCNLAVPFYPLPFTGACAVTGQLTQIAIADPLVPAETRLRSTAAPISRTLDGMNNLLSEGGYGVTDLEPIEDEDGFYLRQVDGAMFLSPPETEVQHWYLFPEHVARNAGGQIIAVSSTFPLIYASYGTGQEGQMARVQGEVTRSACAQRDLLGYYVAVNVYPAFRDQGVWLLNSNGGGQGYEKAHATTFVKAPAPDSTAVLPFEILVHAQGLSSLNASVTAWPIYDDRRGYPTDYTNFLLSNSETTTLTPGTSVSLTAPIEILEDCP